MSRKIRTYNDLLREESRMQELVQAQKELVLYDLGGLQDSLQPATNALGFLGKITTRDNHNLLITAGMNRIIDIVIKRVVLARAGWLTRLTLPFLLKNYSSHYIAGHKDKWLQKLLSLIQKNGNGQAAPVPEEEPERA